MHDQVLYHDSTRAVDAAQHPHGQAPISARRKEAPKTPTMDKRGKDEHPIIVSRVDSIGDDLFDDETCSRGGDAAGEISPQDSPLRKPPTVEQIIEGNEAEGEASNAILYASMMEVIARQAELGGMDVEGSM